MDAESTSDGAVPTCLPGFYIYVGLSSFPAFGKKGQPPVDPAASSTKVRYLVTYPPRPQIANIHYYSAEGLAAYLYLPVLLSKELFSCRKTQLRPRYYAIDCLQRGSVMRWKLVPGFQLWSSGFDNIEAEGGVLGRPIVTGGKR
ncbi:hypothetical protein QR685DRAFT_435741 [Neurospora intermedia]|uniref:Uncharacterized protein n=1 Tax=Neurospora intermedia TaxID=5142 RepID=A0ABR3DJJ6_NEUIN